MKRLFCMVSLLSLVIFLNAQSVGQAQPGSTLERGRTCAIWFFAGQLESLWAQFAPDVKKALPFEGLKSFRQQVEQELGHETKLLHEEIKTIQGFQVYVRSSSFEKSNLQVEMVFAFDSAGLVVGFQIQPKQALATTRFLEYQTKTSLRLPFTGVWYVVWGGRTLEQNYHAAYPDQRFAYDFVVLRNDSTHTGKGSSNEEYFSFGLPLLAPADAQVVSVVDGLPDNKPGVMNPAQAAGNHVWLEFGNGEFALLAHFKQGSLRVKPGQQVKAGEVLGLCGNSGNSSEPHLHVHLQTTALFGQGEGLPAQFVDYMANGVLVDRGEPMQGQLVSAR